MWMVVRPVLCQPLLMNLLHLYCSMYRLLSVFHGDTNMFRCLDDQIKIISLNRTCENIKNTRTEITVPQLPKCRIWHVSVSVIYYSCIWAHHVLRCSSISSFHVSVCKTSGTLPSHTLTNTRLSLFHLLVLKAVPWPVFGCQSRIFKH